MLASFGRRRLEPGIPNPDRDWVEDARGDLACAIAEEAFIEACRKEIAARATTAPSSPDDFMEWYEALRENGPGQGDPLFVWLEEQATYDQMRWFICQEVAGEAGFDDLVALTQLRFPTRPKLELARNYWDEMGRGKAIGMHGPMLGHLADYLNIGHESDDTVVWESCALGNLLVGLAANRRYAYHSIGALGAIELTAPTRANRVWRGLERLGFSKDASRYYRLHATLDLQHSEDWNREVIKPLIVANPSRSRFIAEGALMRLAAGARCFERYRQELRVPSVSPRAASKRRTGSLA